MKMGALGLGGLLVVMAVAIAGATLLDGVSPAKQDATASARPTPTGVAEQSATTTPAPIVSLAPTISPTATPGVPVAPSQEPEPTSEPLASPARSPDPSPTATPPASPTDSPPAAASPSPVAHGWQQAAVFWNDRDSWSHSPDLRAVLDRGHGERLALSVPSIAVGREGSLHVVWTSVGYERDHEIGGVLYATNASGSWRLTELTSPRAGSYDTAAQIAIDRSGSVAIAFSRYEPDGIDNEAMYLMVNRSGSWSEMIEVPYRYDSFYNGTLAVHDGVAHLTYVTGRNTGGPWQVWHAAYDGSWTSTEIAEFAQGHGPRAHSIAATDSGELRIAFIVGNAIYVASGATGSLTLEAPTTSTASLNAPLLLAFDGHGDLHLVSGRRYMRRVGGGLSDPQQIFPRVTWTDGCDERVGDGPSAQTLRIAPDGGAHVVSFFDGPFMESPWYATNRDGTFQAIRLYEPSRTYQPGDRVKLRIEECLEHLAIDFFDPIGLDMAVDRRGRPHILTTNRQYFVGPER